MIQQSKNATKLSHFVEEDFIDVPGEFQGVIYNNLKGCRQKTNKKTVYLKTLSKRSKEMIF